MQDDLDLLREYEPILCYSGGDFAERFFPLNVEAFLQRCTLWERRSGLLKWILPARNATSNWNARAQAFAPALQGEARARALAAFDERHFLRFVDPEELRQRLRERDRSAKQELRELAETPTLTRFVVRLLLALVFLGGAVGLWSTSLKCLAWPAGVAGLIVMAFVIRELWRLWRLVQQSVRASRVASVAALLPRLNLAVAALLFLLALWAWQTELTWLVWAGGLGGAFFMLSVFNVFVEKRSGFLTLFGLLGAALLANARGWDGLAWVLGVLAAVGLWLLLAAYVEETFTAGAASILSTLVFSVVGFLPIFFLARWVCGSTVAIACIIIPAWGMLIVSGEQSLVAVLELTSPLRRTASDRAHTVCRELRDLPVERGGARYTYYGRVWRDADCAHAVLQYYYFYAFNDWRYHAGFNLHEGDWEAVFVFLERRGEQWAPCAVGASQHHTGARLVWDSVEKWPDPDGKHPVVYVAAGSHAGYFTSSDKPLESFLQPGWGRRLVAGITRFREDSLAEAEKSRARVDLGRARAAQEGRGFFPQIFAAIREAGTAPLEGQDAAADQAPAGDERTSRREPMAKERPNGQGLVIGPDRPQSASAESEIVPWNAVLLDDRQGWVEFRGLWGHRTRLADESGPPGPKWERPEHKGGVDPSLPQGCAGCRLYWANPLRWLEQAWDVGRAEEAGA